MHQSKPCSRNRMPRPALRTQQSWKTRVGSGRAGRRWRKRRPPYRLDCCSARNEMKRKRGETRNTTWEQVQWPLFPISGACYPSRELFASTLGVGSPTCLVVSYGPPSPAPIHINHRSDWLLLSRCMWAPPVASESESERVSLWVVRQHAAITNERNRNGDSSRAREAWATTCFLYPRRPGRIQRAEAGGRDGRWIPGGDRASERGLALAKPWILGTVSG
jgi:hypothetical protein